MLKIRTVAKRFARSCTRVCIYLRALMYVNIHFFTHTKAGNSHVCHTSLLTVYGTFGITFTLFGRFFLRVRLHIFQVSHLAIHSFSSFLFCDVEFSFLLCFFLFSLFIFLFFFVCVFAKVLSFCG